MQPSVRTVEVLRLVEADLVCDLVELLGGFELIGRHGDAKTKPGAKLVDLLFKLNGRSTYLKRFRKLLQIVQVSMVLLRRRGCGLQAARTLNRRCKQWLLA